MPPMAPNPETAETEDGPDQLEGWLEHQFRRLGIPEDDIGRLANARVDSHRVAWLVRDKKCPVHMVAKILL